MLPVLIQSMHELQVEPYTMGMQFTRSSCVWSASSPHPDRILYPQLHFCDQAYKDISLCLTPAFQYQNFRPVNSVIVMSPALPAWANFIIFCTTYFISGFLHLSMNLILDWRILFWWGLFCFYRMFCSISGLYLLNTPLPEIEGLLNKCFLNYKDTSINKQLLC